MKIVILSLSRKTHFIILEEMTVYFIEQVFLIFFPTEFQADILSIFLE